MSLGLTRSTIEQEVKTNLHSTVRGLTPEDADEIARVVADAIDKNNRQVERDLGWRFANLERFSARG
jgi:hypothetical protein